MNIIGWLRDNLNSVILSVVYNLIYEVYPCNKI